ncbi:hypothetical protein RFI_02942, partial [Reticulomyxa filosa]
KRRTNEQTSQMQIQMQVDVRESEKKIKETLEKYGYSIEQVNRMQIVIATSSKRDDVMKLLQDKEIHIGYSQAVIFDKNKSRY